MNKYILLAFDTALLRRKDGPAYSKTERRDRMQQSPMRSQCISLSSSSCQSGGHRARQGLSRTFIKTPCQKWVNVPRVGSWIRQRIPEILLITSMWGQAGQSKCSATRRGKSLEAMV